MQAPPPSLSDILKQFGGIHHTLDCGMWCRPHSVGKLMLPIYCHSEKKSDPNFGLKILVPKSGPLLSKKLVWLLYLFKQIIFLNATLSENDFFCCL